VVVAALLIYIAPLTRRQFPRVANLFVFLFFIFFWGCFPCYFVFVLSRLGSFGLFLCLASCRLCFCGGFSFSWFGGVVSFGLSVLSPRFSVFLVLAVFAPLARLSVVLSGVLFVVVALGLAFSFLRAFRRVGGCRLASVVVSGLSFLLLRFLPFALPRRCSLSVLPLSAVVLVSSCRSGFASATTAANKKQQRARLTPCPLST
jgi:hypothetical protein